MARSAQRVATGEAPCGQPESLNDSVTADGLSGVIGTRRQEAAGTGKIRRNQHFVGANQSERRANGQRAISAAGEVDVRV